MSQGIQLSVPMGLEDAGGEIPMPGYGSVIAVRFLDVSHIYERVMHQEKEVVLKALIT